VRGHVLVVGLAVELRDDGVPKPFAQPARMVIYRAMRELLINVAKHAGVGNAEVDLSASGNTMIATVRDAGKGFDPALLTASSRKGLGLLGVRERVGFIGGKAEIRSAPGRGCEVVLTVPLQTASEALEDAPA
jgi:signal transduction histidine kinase